MSTVKKKIDIKRREIHNRKQKTVRTLSNVKLFKILHRQFAEPSINKLEALLKDAKKMEGLKLRNIIRYCAKIQNVKNVR